jgi:hypothetical protein
MDQQPKLYAETDLRDSSRRAAQKDIRDDAIHHNEALEVDPRKDRAIGTHQDVHTGQGELNGAVRIPTGAKLPYGQPEADVQDGQ